MLANECEGAQQTALSDLGFTAGTMTKQAYSCTCYVGDCRDLNPNQSIMIKYTKSDQLTQTPQMRAYHRQNLAEVSVCMQNALEAEHNTCRRC
jgi:hypothetical protein